MIEMGVRVDDWPSAIAAAGRLLVRAGAVEDRYIEAMVRVARELGPYIVIAPGVAMPHARPEDGAKRTAVSFVCLEQPVEFGNEENDPVRLVVGLAAVDHDAHIEVMRQLATVLDTPWLLDAIGKVETPEEVQTLILEALREKEDL